MNQLPDKPSELIRLALEDLAKCKAQGYDINMANWYYRAKNNECCVCLAGAVMAQTLGYDKAGRGLPTDFGDESIRDKLWAINGLRCGWVNASAGLIGLNVPPVDFDRFICPYCVDNERFTSDLLTLAADLEERGF